jgi:trypsin
VFTRRQRRLLGDVLMAGKTIRQLTQLLAAAAVVATAFATSQPANGLIDPVSPNEHVREQLTVAPVADRSDAATIESRAPSMVHLHINDAQRARPCSGFFIAAHLVMTARHCVMTQTEAANTALDLGTTAIRGLELLVSHADLDFSLLWVHTDASIASPTFDTPIAAIRARLIDRLPLIEQTNPTAATELRAALK